MTHLPVRHKAAAWVMAAYGLFCIGASGRDFWQEQDVVSLVAGAAAGLVFLFCAAGILVSAKLQEPVGPIVRTALALAGIFMALALIGRFIPRIRAGTQIWSDWITVAGGVVVVIFSYRAAAKKRAAGENNLNDA